MGLFSRFKRNNPSNNVGTTAGNFAGISSADMGLYHMAYERKRQPDAGGARRYAYETLGLVPFSVIGPGVAARNGFDSLEGALLYQKAVPLQGIGMITGGIALGPLTNTNATTDGYPVSPAGIGNQPFPKYLTQSAGEAL